MSSLTLFSFESRQIRALNLDGNPWFVAKDVAEALGYKNPADAVTHHCKGVAKCYPLQTAGGIQEVRIINEPDTFRLIVGSTLSEAERFERWLFEEVLPSIRKTGSYALPGTSAPNDILAAQLAALLQGKMLVDRADAQEIIRVLYALRAVFECVDPLARRVEAQCGQDFVGDLRPDRATMPPPRRPIQPQPTAYEMEADIAFIVAGHDRVTTEQIIRGLGLEPSRGLQTRIGYVMRRLGWIRQQAASGDRQRHYVRLNA